MSPQARHTCISRPVLLGLLAHGLLARARFAGGWVGPAVRQRIQQLLPGEWSGQGVKWQIAQRIVEATPCCLSDVAARRIAK